MQPAPPKKIVFWAIWAALSWSVVVYRVFLPGVVGESNSMPAVMMWPFLLVPAAIAIVCRWVVIPKQKQLPQQLVTSIIGLAMAESISFYGLFLFTPQLDLFFVVSLIMVLQFMPIYLITAPADVKDMSRTHA